jgi:hypothetical protein
MTRTAAPEIQAKAPKKSKKVTHFSTNLFIILMLILSGRPIPHHVARGQHQLHLPYLQVVL